MNIELMKDITIRNLKACESAERKSKRIADVFYYKGKADALSHFLEMIDEYDASNQS